MRLSSIVLLLVVSIQFNSTFYSSSVADAFVTIPTWVAFGAITAAVKLKLILVKIMFALKTMGVGSIRFKRSAHSDFGVQLYNVANSEYGDLLDAWTELEVTAGRRISFILDSCISAAVAGNTKENSKQRRRRSATSGSQSNVQSKFVSSIIGSITGSIAACQILEDALQIHHKNQDPLHP